MNFFGVSSKFCVSFAFVVVNVVELTVDDDDAVVLFDSVTVVFAAAEPFEVTGKFSRLT